MTLASNFDYSLFISSVYKVGGVGCILHYHVVCLLKIIHGSMLYQLTISCSAGKSFQSFFLYNSKIEIHFML